MRTRSKYELSAIAITLVLMAIVVRIQSGVSRNVLNAAIRQEIRHALDEYRAAFGAAPDTLDIHQLVACLCQGANPQKRIFLPSGPGTVFDLMLNPAKDTFIDIWGHELRFLRGTDGNITIWSAGPNGVFEDSPGSDDIRF